MTLVMVDIKYQIELMWLDECSGIWKKCNSKIDEKSGEKNVWIDLSEQAKTMNLCPNK